MNNTMRGYTEGSGVCFVCASVNGFRFLELEPNI